jgi:NADH-quinone oxidoreductase subunit A
MLLYEEYLPILVFFLLSVIIGVVLAAAGKIISKMVGADKPNPEKTAPFECGFPEFDTARSRFDVRFYLVAILFLIFDLEIAYMFPWAIVMNDIGWAGFVSMMIFLFILTVGFVYEWKKGALEWE